MDLILEHNRRLYVTGHAQIIHPGREEHASFWTGSEVANNNPGFLWVGGKFVEADRPNLNKAFWSKEDLEFGEATIRYTPMNILHKMSEPIGVFTETKMAPANDKDMAHIQAVGALWAHRFPLEASLVELANANNTLFYSMECVAEKLHCKGGCEEEFDYYGEWCEHLENRSSIRHLVNPIFTGGALIVPPSRPAWPNADVEVLASLTEEYAKSLDNQADAIAEVDDSLKPSQWRSLMNQVVAYAARND